MADAEDRSRSPVPKPPDDAKDVLASALDGETWKISLGASESVAELRQKVAEVAGIPKQEVVLVRGTERLGDQQMLLAEGGALEEVQLLRVEVSFQLQNLKKALAELE
mmetsp:Transcript_7104/g.7716  ORF Transcript_7104/g.7716 Transcript_7104/m.7716 type:complete len:108 (-) Transcript_7104:108-431(-)